MAGAKSGKALMGLSLARGGAAEFGNLGAPAEAGMSPMKPKKASFNSPGTKRNGSTKYESYPDMSTSNSNYCGGTGTGQHGGSQHCM